MEQKSLTVGISSFPPLIKEVNGTFNGFEIELWEKIAKEMNLSFTYKKYDFKQLLPELVSKKIDVAMAGLTMTQERENSIDFTHSTLNTGLHILVSNKTSSSLKVGIKSIFSKEVRNIFLILIAFVIIAAHVIWFIEKDGHGTLSGPYWPGIFNAAWWSLVTLSTIGYGDYTPVTHAGRLAGMLIILSGLAIFGLYIGQISSAITLKRLRSDISTPEDLRGKKVATKDGTVSVVALNKLAAKVVPTQTIEDAYKKLEQHKVDAVVFDAPVLLEYAYHEGKNSTTIVGGLFERQNYGIALEEGSPYREGINRAILKLTDSGEYTKLYEKWFGEDF